MAEDPLADWDFHAEARDLGLSLVQLRRLMRSRTGDPPERHLARLRMQQAGRWLLAGMTGAWIADRLGMHDASHFSRRFRVLMGTSPSAWLARMQAG